MPHVITVVRYYSGGKASWGKRGARGPWSPPYVAKCFVYLGRAVLGLRVAGVQYYPGHFGWESSADYGKGYF